MAQFLQTALGHSPLGAGIRLLPWTGAPMAIAPIAGAPSERFGDRPFIVLGMTLQAVGLGWIALIAAPGMGYLELGVALTIAGALQRPGRHACPRYRREVFGRDAAGARRLRPPSSTCSISASASPMYSARRWRWGSVSRAPVKPKLSVPA